MKHNRCFINVSVPRDRSTPEAVVVKEDVIEGCLAFLRRGNRLLEVVKSLEILVVCYDHFRDFRDATAGKWLLLVSRR